MPNQIHFKSRGIGGGGALYSLSINPIDDQEIFLACDMTQLFHTQNAGLDWSMVDFKELVVTPQSEVQFHTISNTSSLSLLN